MNRKKRFASGGLVKRELLSSPVSRDTGAQAQSRPFLGGDMASKNPAYQSALKAKIDSASDANESRSGGLSSWGGILAGANGDAHGKGLMGLLGTSRMTEYAEATKDMPKFGRGDDTPRHRGRGGKSGMGGGRPLDPMDSSFKPGSDTPRPGGKGGWGAIDPPHPLTGREGDVPVDSGAAHPLEDMVNPRWEPPVRPPNIPMPADAGPNAPVRAGITEMNDRLVALQEELDAFNEQQKLPQGGAVQTPPSSPQQVTIDRPGQVIVGRSQRGQGLLTQPQQTSLGAAAIRNAQEGFGGRGYWREQGPQESRLHYEQSQAAFEMQRNMEGAFKMRGNEPVPVRVVEGKGLKGGGLVKREQQGGLMRNKKKKYI